MCPQSYYDVTEIAGEGITRVQLRRQVERYRWATAYCSGKDVFEVACGAGAGLGMLARIARRVQGGDIDSTILSTARCTYGGRIPLQVCDAEKMPLDDASLDVVILFEAIYYLARADRFVAECRRVLRPGGRVLVATANKDLYDFTPSPFAHRYYNAGELAGLFAAYGFDSEFFGGSAIAVAGLLYRVLRPIKALATKLNLMPKTMVGKQWLKRMIFGALVEMPRELSGEEATYEEPERIAPTADVKHHVLYCVATRLDQAG